MKPKINRRAKAKEIFDKVVKNVQTIVENGEYTKYLKFQNQFTKYSFNNIVLIYSQFPDATKVAGRAKWGELGRELINNAKRIQITAGMPAQGKTTVKKLLMEKKSKKNRLIII